MERTEPFGFTHRSNIAAGTVDSICHRCFATIATATVEADLHIPEQRHTCCPEDDLRLELISQAAKMMPN